MLSVQFDSDAVQRYTAYRCLCSTDVLRLPFQSSLRHVGCRSDQEQGLHPVLYVPSVISVRMNTSPCNATTHRQVAMSYVRDGIVLTSLSDLGILAELTNFQNTIFVPASWHGCWWSPSQVYSFIWLCVWSLLVVFNALIWKTWLLLKCDLQRVLRQGASCPVGFCELLVQG
jgi:hypothetical protein